MNDALLRHLVCPYSGASLLWFKEKNELWCRASKLAYPIVDGIPVMLIDQARALSDAEYESMK